MTKKKSDLSRRTFLSNVAVIGASGTLGAGSLLTACSGGGSNENKLTPLRPAGEVYIPDLPDKAIEGKPIKAALIGCGSRGTGAAFNFLSAGDGLSIVACADIFKDRMDGCRKKLKEERNNEIADDMCFLGFDAYKKACEAPVDMVIIATPTLFHPEQVKYAIDQGKHVFCEKPAAIDAVGYRTYMMAVKQAQTSGLCIVTGTQRHHQRGYVESYKKVQEGYIGRITSANVYWNQGIMNFARRRPEWTDMEYMFRDFFSWNWLCGDHVIDQLVHNVDVFTWFSHLKPVRVIGMGSRLRRFTGNIYDNFSVDFEYEGGVHVHGMARQIDNCDNRVAEIIQGTKGSWNTLNDKFTILDLDGNTVWQYDKEAEKANFKQNDPYVLEHVNLVNHIRNGKVINIAETTAISSMACIMARESAYTGKAYTWDEMTQSDLSYMPAELTLGNVDMSKYEAIPLPGTTPKA
ncbi:MAG: Gfo/Idh/MocA family oxidoreductase [Bacteroidales bacterium]|nr:Gfo/Idh/MocA family oxidoreductase [Bacteroidales bacterium]